MTFVPALLTAALLFPPTAFDLVTAAEIDALAVSPDGSSVVFSWTRLGDADLWVLPISGGEPRLLVAEPGDESDPSFSPDGRSVAFVGEGRGESADIFVVRLSDGAIRNLTDHPAPDLAPRFSADGSRVAFLSDRDGHGADLFEVDAFSPGPLEPRKLSRGGGLQQHDLGVDGHWVRRTKMGRRGVTAEIRLLSSAGGRGTRLVRGLLTFGLPSRSPDGGRLVQSAQHGSRSAIALLSPRGRAVDWLASDDDADHLTPRYSPRGDALAYVRRTDEASQLVVRMDDGSGAITVSPANGSVGAYAWIPGGSALVYTHSHSTHPRSLFVTGLEGRPARLLVDAAPGLAKADLRRATRVSIPRPHGAPLRAWVVEPKPERASRGVVLVRDNWGSVPDAYSPTVQFFASTRYAVVVLDLAAMSDTQSDVRVEDVSLAATWMAREALAAPGRIGVVGEGWLGGHVALRAAATAPEAVRAAVTVGGAADRDSLTAGCPVEARAWLDTLVAGHDRHAKKPMSSDRLAESLEAVMWVYGTRDPMLESAKRMGAQMEKRGAQTPAVLYEGEGAPLRGRRNRAHALEQVADFLMKRL